MLWFEKKKIPYMIENGIPYRDALEEKKALFDEKLGQLSGFVDALGTSSYVHPRVKRTVTKKLLESLRLSSETVQPNAFKRWRELEAMKAKSKAQDADLTKLRQCETIVANHRSTTTDPVVDWERVSAALDDDLRTNARAADELQKAQSDLETKVQRWQTFAEDRQWVSRLTEWSTDSLFPQNGSFRTARLLCELSSAGEEDTQTALEALDLEVRRAIGLEKRPQPTVFKAGWTLESVEKQSSKLTKAQAAHYVCTKLRPYMESFSGIEGIKLLTLAAALCDFALVGSDTAETIEGMLRNVDRLQKRWPRERLQDLDEGDKIDAYDEGPVLSCYLCAVIENTLLASQ